MEREIRIVIASVLVTVAFSASGAFAQQPQNNSARMTNARSYRLKDIEGQVVYGDVAEKGEFLP